MADPDLGEETDAPATAPDFSANALRRMPATIDATALDVTPPEPLSHDAAGPVAETIAHTSDYDVTGHIDEIDRQPEMTEAALEAEPMHETALPADESPAPINELSPGVVAAPRDAPQRQGGILAPLLIALIVGAAAGFGGAYGWAYYDKSDEKLDALTQQVAGFVQQQTAATGLADAQGDLASRLKAVEATTQADETALTSLRSDVDKLAQRNPTASVVAAPDVAPLTAQLSTLQMKLATLTGQFGDLSSKVAAQTSQVAATQHLVTQTAVAHGDDTAVAIIAGNLLRKVEAGAPFADDLSALESRGIDKMQLAALTANATTGIATPGALSRQFADETDAILSTAPAPKSHSFLDRLMKDAEGLVQIRKIGDTAGDGLAAHVARIQNTLDAGSVEAAYQQWSDLPDAAKDKSRGFGAAAKLRLDVIAAAHAIEAEALAGLGKAKS